MADNDMQRLQQEAIRRAQEMQQRARAVQEQAEQDARHSGPHGGQPVQTPQAQAQQTTPPPHGENAPKDSGFPFKAESLLGGLLPGLSDGPVGNLLDSLFQDGERSLILILILLLVEEKADSGLVFALMYLIL